MHPVARGVVRSCPQCGSKDIQLAGGIVEYKGVYVELGQEVEIPTCQGCGLRFCDGTVAVALDGLLNRWGPVDLLSEYQKQRSTIQRFKDRNQELKGLLRGMVCAVNGQYTSSMLRDANEAAIDLLGLARLVVCAGCGHGFPDEPASVSGWLCPGCKAVGVGAGRDS